MIPGSSSSRTWTFLAVAAGAGAATMIVELAAVRLLAPWFGTSQTVWTNVIGVVLLALSAGYLAGARLSARASPERALGVVLALAAACAGVLPFAAAPVARGFLPEGLALDEALELLRWGSLATALVLFLPPALLLGCVSPLCAEALDRAQRRGAGASGGRVLAVSTLGSLAGTFATSWFLVPVCGITRTFLIAAGVLALLAFVTLVRTRGAGLASLALVPLALFAAGDARRPPPARGETLLEARESAYQSVRVVRFGAPGPDEERQLQVNEAFDSFQSVWRPAPGPIGGGSYYDVFALPPWWAGARVSWSVCVLGLGAGTAWRVLDGALPPDCQLLAFGVELDPAVVELGERWMDLERGPGREILGGCDARAALAHVQRRFDQIVLDAYANQIEIPPHLATREFFALVREHLTHGGFVTVNVGAFGLDDPVLERVACALADGVGSEALALRVPFSRNVAVCARAGAPLPSPDSAEWVPDHTGLADLARRLALPLAQRRFAPGSGLAPTDDRSDLELRQIESLARASNAHTFECPDLVSAPAANAPHGTDAGVQRALAERFARGEFTAALAYARALPAGVERARAEVLALYQAGDLRAALAAGLAALARTPDDAALAWRTGEIAVSLGAADAARCATDALALALARGTVPAGDRAEWVRAHATRTTEVRELAERAERSRGAFVRARGVALALLGACGVVLVALGAPFTNSAGAAPSRSPDPSRA